MRKVVYTVLALLLLLGLIIPVSTAIADEYGPYYIAAHAVVVNDGGQEETAWGNCQNSQPFSENCGWARYFVYPYGANVWGLFAGGIDYDDLTKNLIGKIQVWIDGNWLKIKYVITDPAWHIIETHVAVGESLGDIPQTKKGNPKVGHFAIFGGEKSGVVHDPPVQTYLYTYDLSTLP